MLPSIGLPSWLEEDYEMPNTLVFETDSITRSFCYFEKRGKIVAVKGSLNEVRQDLHELIEGLLDLEGVTDVAVNENIILLNANDGICSETLEQASNLTYDIWNIIHMTGSQLDELADEIQLAMDEPEEWPDVIG